MKTLMLMKKSTLFFAIAVTAMIPVALAQEDASATSGRDQARSMVMTKFGIVSTSQTLASQAGARILEEGIALRSVDIDIVYLNGYGFPAWRGGPMFYADTVGLKNVLAKIEEFEKSHGELWAPAPLLKKLAESGKTFGDFDKEKGA